MLGFGFTAVLFAIILSSVLHYLSGAIRLQTPGPKITVSARRHLTVLVFVFLVLKAIAYWLDRYGFVFSDRSKFTGASYADVHAALPARTILFWICIIIAAGVLASIWLRSTLLPAIGFVSMLVLSILISGIYPAIVQQVTVKPNASTKEAPYIKKNINATRQAYGICHRLGRQLRRLPGDVTSRSGGPAEREQRNARQHPNPRPEHHLGDVQQVPAVGRQRVRVRAEAGRRPIHDQRRRARLHRRASANSTPRTCPAIRPTGSTSTRTTRTGTGSSPPWRTPT